MACLCTFLAGTARGRCCRRYGESIAWRWTFLISMRSCCLRRRDKLSKPNCCSSASYCIGTSVKRQRLQSHVMNLCCIRSNRSKWVAAAPPHTTVPYSRIDLTLAQYDVIIARESQRQNERPCFPVWNDRIRRPSALLALRTVKSMWSANVSFSSRTIPKSRISLTLSNDSPPRVYTPVTRARRSENENTISKFQTPFDSPVRELPVQGQKFDPEVTDDVTGQVKVRIFDFFGLGDIGE